MIMLEMELIINTKSLKTISKSNGLLRYLLL